MNEELGLVLRQTRRTGHSANENCERDTQKRSDPHRFTDAMPIFIYQNRTSSVKQSPTTLERCEARTTMNCCSKNSIKIIHHNPLSFECERCAMILKRKNRWFRKGRPSPYPLRSVVLAIDEIKNPFFCVPDPTPPA